jgi:hypothetical protein
MAETPEQRGLDHSESRLWRYCSWMAASRERSALFNGAVASGWAVVIDNSSLETNLLREPSMALRSDDSTYVLSDGVALLGAFALGADVWPGSRRVPSGTR